MSGRQRWIAVLVAAVGMASLAQAQRPNRIAPREGGKAMRGSGRRPGGPPPGRKSPPERPAGRGNMVDHLMSLPPGQQQVFMRNNPRFRRLPPEQQENVQRRLEQFNRLPEARREALRERYELFRQMSPERQDHARALYRQWNQYTPDRRQELMREFRQLRDASPEERRARMDGEDFRNRYGESEQELLRGLVDLLPEPE